MFRIIRLLLDNGKRRREQHLLAAWEVGRCCCWEWWRSKQQPFHLLEVKVLLGLDAVTMIDDGVSCCCCCCYVVPFTLLRIGYCVLFSVDIYLVYNAAARPHLLTLTIIVTKVSTAHAFYVVAGRALLAAWSCRETRGDMERYFDIRSSLNSSILISFCNRHIVVFSPN